MKHIAPLSSIISVVAVMVETLFVVTNSLRNAVTEHNCYVFDTIIKFFTKTMVIDVDIDTNDTIVSNFNVILGGII